MYDALVIGAGPAGSTAARLLSRAGWRVVIVEKSVFPRRKVCGEFISATSLLVFDDDSLREEFLRLAGPDVRRVGLFARNENLSAMMPNLAVGNGWGRALGREHLDTLLVRAAHVAGAEIWQPWKVTGISKIDGGYRCDVENDAKREILESRIIIAASGSWEQGPYSVGAPKHRPSDLLAFKAHFQGGNLSAGLMPLLAFPGGYGGMVHTDSGRVSLSCCIRRDRLARCRKDYPASSAAGSVLLHIMASCGAARSALSQAALYGKWLAAGPIRPGIRALHRDGIFMIGNLAGEAHPIVAEGISMAMQSACLLCAEIVKIRNDLGDDKRLAEVGNAYAQKWKALFASRIRAAAVFAHVAMRPEVSSVALPVLKKFPEILTWGARLSGKTKLAPLPGS